MHCSQVNFKWKWNRCDCLKMWSNYLIYELNQCCLFDCEKERKTAFDFNLFCILNSFGLGVLQKMLFVVLLILNDLYLHEKKTGNISYILFVYIIWCDGQSLNRFAMYMPASKWKRLRSCFAMFENSREYLLNGYCLYRATRTKIKQLKWKKLKEPTHSASLNKNKSSNCALFLGYTSVDCWRVFTITCRSEAPRGSCFLMLF